MSLTFSRMMMLNRKGFTLIEAMLAITILTISLLGVVAMQAYLGSQTTDKAVLNCLLDTASNTLAQYRANADTITSPVLCDEGRISVTVAGSAIPSTTASNIYPAYPAQSVCADVTITTSAKGKTFKLSSYVCNFP